MRFVGCSLDDQVINHMLYADEIVVFALSAKGLQTLLNLCDAYGFNDDEQYNAVKYVAMYINSRMRRLHSRILC